MFVQNAKWSRSPRKIVTDNISLFKKGSVLELGGSDGVNLLLLAQAGFDVTNVDIDAEALENFNKQAKILDLTVQSVESDLNNFKLDKNYDNVLCFFTLHFLAKETGNVLLNSFLEHTSPGGLNILIALTDVSDSPVNKEHFFLHNDQLLELYRNWDIRYYKKEMAKLRSGKMWQRASIVALNQ